MIACAACAVVPLLGCNKDNAQAATSSGVTTPAVAAATAKPDTTSAKKGPLEGRCENETSDAPYGSLYFYPGKGELFVTLDGDNSSRIPITVTKTDPDKTTFTYRWAGSGVKVATTETATVGWVGTQKWSFDFETIKDSVCHPVADDLFTKKLPEIGIAAGKYLDAKSNDTITVVAESQKLIDEEKGKTTILYYRVRSKSDDAGIKLIGSWEAPNDSSPEVWGSIVVTVVGEDVMIQFNKTLTRKYSPVK